MHSDRDRLHAPLRSLVLCLVCTCRLVRGVDTGPASLHNASYLGNLDTEQSRYTQRQPYRAQYRRTEGLFGGMRSA
jgi:hypothetical protein